MLKSTMHSLRSVIWVSLLLAGTGCRQGDSEQAQKSLPNSERECRLFAMKRATSADLGTFLLNQCLLTVPPAPSEPLYNAILDVLNDGIEGSATVDPATGKFTAIINNTTGVNLKNLVFQVSLYRNEKALAAAKTTPGPNEKREPPTIRTVRIAKDHKNLTIEKYESDIDATSPSFGWSIIDAEGYRIPGVKTSSEHASDEFREELKELREKFALTPPPAPEAVVTPQPK